MRRRYLALLLVVLVAAAAIGSGRTFAAFSATTANSSSLSSTADFIAPAVTRASVSKQTGYAPDYIHQGGTYYVYAQVTDSGNPSSGISSACSRARFRARTNAWRSGHSIAANTCSNGRRLASRSPRASFLADVVANPPL